MEAVDCPIVRRKRPWGLTFFGLLAVGGLVAMPLVAGDAGGVEMPDWVRFLGHFHPVLLHLPIGVFAMILFQELGAIFGRRARDPGEAQLFPMFFGAASAIVAVIAGFLFYHGHGDDYGGEDLAERHLWGGLVFAIMAVLAFVMKAWTVALAANPAWYRSVFFGALGVMGFASHDGASLTHGTDYLTKYAPNPLRMLLGLKPNKVAAAVTSSEDLQVYADVVAPILERRCVSCHKEGKSKGKLRMDTYEMLVKGGKEGPSIEPGSAEESNIIFRMDLPEDDEEHMPPEGKPKVEMAEYQVIRWWLDQGAPSEGRLAEFDTSDEVLESIEQLAAIPRASEKDAESRPEPGQKGPDKEGPDKEVVAFIDEFSKEYPGALSFEFQGSSSVTLTAVSMVDEMDDKVFGRLGTVMPHLVSINLSATRVTDDAVRAMEAAKNLRMLRLAETEITDAAIDTLVKLPSLESVNFYGTKVTDTGVLKLAALPNLKRLYLWQTAVTPEAIKELGEKLPDCEIVTGAVLAADGPTEGK